MRIRTLQTLIECLNLGTPLMPISPSFVSPRAAAADNQAVHEHERSLALDVIGDLVRDHQCDDGSTRWLD
ncbi:hypothetical protein MRX96_041789 [Rhipicephalus microplus]